MTNANTGKNTTQPAPAGGVSTQPKESIMSKIGGGFSWWIGSLTGKPQARKAPVSQPQPQVAPSAPVNQTPAQSATPQTQPTAPASGTQPGTQVLGNATGSEDSVTEDIKKFQKLVGKFSTDMQKKMGPVVSKGLETSSQKASSFGESNKKFIRTVMKIFFIVIFIIVAGFIGLKFYKQLPNGGKAKVTPTVVPGQETPTDTPTPVVYNPTKPSVYAQDPVILKFEQDIDVLVREISGTNVKETQLNPPTADFDIKFN